MKARERDEVRPELAQVRVELARESERSRDAAHDSCDERIELRVGRILSLEVALEDVVELLVVEIEDEIGVVDELVERKHGIVPASRTRTFSADTVTTEARETGTHGSTTVSETLGDGRTE